jgi:hypothetical protein
VAARGRHTGFVDGLANGHFLLFLVLFLLIFLVLALLALLVLLVLLVLLFLLPSVLDHELCVRACACVTLQKVTRGKRGGGKGRDREGRGREGLDCA